MTSIASRGVMLSSRMLTVPMTLSLTTMFMPAWRARLRSTRPISSPWNSWMRLAVAGRTAGVVVVSTTATPAVAGVVAKGGTGGTVTAAARGPVVSSTGSIGAGDA